MANIELDVKALSDAPSVDLSKAARNKRGRRNVPGPLDRFRPLFHDDPVGVCLKFAVDPSGGGKGALMPVLCFSWTYDRGQMMFPDHRTLYVPAAEPFVPPNTDGEESLAEGELVERGVGFLRGHNLKLVASDPSAPVLRLECRIRKKSERMAASITFKIGNTWLEEQCAVWRGL